MQRKHKGRLITSLGRIYGDLLSLVLTLCHYHYILFGRKSKVLFQIGRSYSLCYIPLHLILIVHLLPSQSNDEVSEVFVLMGDAGDDPLCYILEQ